MSQQWDSSSNGTRSIGSRTDDGYVRGTEAYQAAELGFTVDDPTTGVTTYETAWEAACTKLEAAGASIGTLLDEQRRLQLTFGHDFSKMTTRKLVQYVRDMVLALTDEAHEALAETSWKPWQTALYFNVDAYKGEIIDAFHLLLNLMLAGDMTGSEVTELYRSKHRVNEARQSNGYAGTNKCPICRRSLDDPATECVVVDHRDGTTPHVVCVELRPTSTR